MFLPESAPLWLTLERQTRYYQFLHEIASASDDWFPMIGSRNYASFMFAIGSAGAQIHAWTKTCWARDGWAAAYVGILGRAMGAGALPAMFLLRSGRTEIYNILWGLVFGFATLNILSLGTRRFEQEKSGLSFGELLAVLVVLVSIVLLASEMLYVFHILPIQLSPR